MHQRHINDLCVKRSVTLLIFIFIWQEEVLGEECWVWGEEAGEGLLTLRRVASQGGLEELDSICRAQGLPLFKPLELNGLRCLCVRAHLLYVHGRWSR